ncbi:LacI family DNA-binding transcriptional regulator [Crenobacter sp. SG2305]|uniref:LacI family DNA-binding transcriptional regulator n=1 Tax=Crenobacter oryzisoli TaxID=3056844 RepID=UPI0025AA7CD2|nr:LacI family DNA-binding transcriptional regulator [Crenobacter sp. SG2305]MDN0085260.1 LacI family DNA-binding transcriptional regulator [Crenobacter sp. SG2305]
MPRKPRLRSGSGVTLHDIGLEVGVSAITVSRALNSPERVSEALRDKIREAVERLGYVPNRSARALASARSQTVLVLIPSLTNTVFIDTLAGIEEVLRAAGYQMLIGNTHYSADEELQLLRAYLEHQPDGILVTGLSQPQEFNSTLERLGIPAVYMMDLADDGRLCVGFSQEEAGAAITSHLLARGYRRIAFMGAQLDERVLKRLDGYRDVLRAGQSYDASLEYLDPAPSSMQMGAEMVERILHEHSDCDAVFCCNDDLAIGAIAQCQRLGLEVPGRVAIVGFNDLQPAGWVTPALTTVATPRYRIGVEAARLLLDRIAGHAVASSRLDLGFEIVVRASS